MQDDDLIAFEARGAQPLPLAAKSGWIESDGARIWWASYGKDSSPCVTLLHGGLGNAGNWGWQIEPLLASGYRLLLIDSRGHGRSSCDDKHYSYQLMSRDVLVVLDHLAIGRTAIVGWSDGACTGLELCRSHPHRVAGLLFFGCNVDASGSRPFALTPAIERCFSRHRQDYAALSSTPDQFQEFVDAVSLMQQTQPDLSQPDLAKILARIVVVHAEKDEFIWPEHAEYLSHALPNASLMRLPDVSHFAPLQRPHVFNAAVMSFLRDIGF